jgi:prepilin-type N-terminal cleavage/methylation domain-containing protein
MAETDPMVYTKYFSNRGFTLLEMVLVIFLIGLAASSLVVVIGGVDDQARYEETAHRYERILNAILGRSDLELNGSPVVSGFIADMGRLPTAIDELISKPDDVLDYDLIAGNFIDAAEGEVLLRHGWRGPYLSSAGSPTKDAWGGDFQLSWDDSIPEFIFYSQGKDRADGGFDPGEEEDSYVEADYPSTNNTVSENLYQVTQGTLTLTFVNNRAGYDNPVVGILYPGLDTSDPIGEFDTGNSLGADYHESIILPQNTDSSPFEATPGEITKAPPISIASEFPGAGLIRKFQLIVYESSGSETDKLEEREYVLHEEIFYLLPQADAKLEATIVLN